MFDNKSTETGKKTELELRNSRESNWYLLVCKYLIVSVLHVFYIIKYYAWYFAENNTFLHDSEYIIIIVLRITDSS